MSDISLWGSGENRDWLRRLFTAAFSSHRHTFVCLPLAVEPFSQGSNPAILINNKKAPQGCFFVIGG